ncbi:MAG: HlyD family efflux transporter periplasmic adaptor subunit [Bacteroidetes bacterium]|nr:HlyD family efflux transporter periplasmic adaptor subunit [Bacteroidota bacterium]
MKNLIAIGLVMVILSSCGKNTNEVSPQYKEITEMVFASGILEPDNIYNLTAQSEGYIVKLNITEGDIVKSGDVLAIVDNKQSVFSDKSATELLSISQTNVSTNAPALKQAEANIVLAAEKVKQDETQVTRYKKLLESNSVSKVEYENVLLALENSKTNLSNLEQAYKLQKQQADQQLIAQESQKNINAFFSDNNNIKAVVGGEVYKKMKETGDYVRKGDIIAVIGNANELYARLNIDESNIAKIKIGQNVIIQLNTSKETNYDGIVSEILPAFEDASQSFICKVKFSKEPDLKISGTQLQANIIIGSKAKAFVIPRRFLDFGNKVSIKGVDNPVDVKTGFISSEWVEIVEGLKESDVLIYKNK